MHLYVHIPFCHRICPYCSFYKHTPASTDMKRFVEALLVEAASREAELSGMTPGASRTLYFGGGTPSMLSSTHFKRLTDGIDELANIGSLDEFSFEANPATFTQRKIAGWADAGVTRISLGVQSWDPAILKLLGREHTPELARSCFRQLRNAGIRDINIDLMFSIPGQSEDAWAASLEDTLKLEPDHISAYNLTYEEDTAFFEQLGKGLMQRDEERDARMFERAHERLTTAGYRHYETSNFARNGRVSLHNSAYWTGEDYVGIGPGAVSTLGNRRIQNTADTLRYIESTLRQGLPDSETETLTADDKALERLALMLRTDTGAPVSLISTEKRNTLALLEQEGLGFINEHNYLILKEKGRLLVDEVIVELTS